MRDYSGHTLAPTEVRLVKIAIVVAIFFGLAILAGSALMLLDRAAEEPGDIGSTCRTITA